MKWKCMKGVGEREEERKREVAEMKSRERNR